LVFSSYSTIFTILPDGVFAYSFQRLTFLVCCYPIVVIVLSTSSLSRSEPLRWVRFILPQLIRQLTPYPRMPVRWHTCLLPQGEQPLTVASCTLRHRFCISSACPSSLLWVHPTPLNALVWLSHQVIPRLLLSFQLSPATQKRVGSWFNIGEDVKRSPLVTQESFRNHPCHDHPIVHYSAQVSACDGSVTSR
jgi:hypothetical protein